MKYRFAGGQDVPEWVLAEVSVLSKIVRMKRLGLASIFLRLIAGLTPHTTPLSILFAVLHSPKIDMPASDLCPCWGRIGFGKGDETDPS
jgi:hypothetical protein